LGIKREMKVLLIDPVNNKMENKTTKNYADFEEDSKWTISDPIKKKNYQIVLKNFSVKKFDAIEQENKRDINDFNCELTDGTKLKLEFKNRRLGAICSDMALEVHNDYNKKTDGCVFKLIKNNIDYYIYTWHGKKKACYIILKARELEKWWRKNYSKYPLRLNKPTIKDGMTWQSSYCFVPIKDIPKEIVYKHETFIDLNDFWDAK